MKKIYTFGFFCLLTSILLAQSTPELLWYKFDGSGNTVTNLASSPPTGTTTATLMGGLTQGGSGICSGTVIGTGIASTSDYVNTGWATNLTGTSWTISMRTKDIVGTTTLYYIFGDANAGSFRCFTNGVAGANNWILRGTLTDVLCTGCAGSPSNMTTFVYDMTLGNIKAYLNGALVNTVTQTGPTIAGTGPFKVVGYGTNVGAPLNGLLDDFRLYNRALSAQEIMDIYTGAVSNFLPADQMICSGDTLPLTIPYPGGTYTWSNGATTNAIYVDTAGVYVGSVASTCANGSDTITITAAPALLTAGFAGPDDTICVGDTISLSISSMDTILWSTGSTTDSIWVASPGVYTVDVSAYCGTVSDTVIVAASALVYANFEERDTTFPCMGDSVQFTVTGVYDSYLWSTGDTSASIWVTATGSYAVTVSDGCGSGSDTLSIVFIAPAAAAFSTSVNQMSATFTNTSTGGGAINYLWSFGDGNTDTQFSPSHTYAANGTYLVSLTVSNECGSSTVMDTVIINFVGIANSLRTNVQVFPNPAKDQIVIAADFSEIQNIRISLVSLMGQEMQVMNYNNVAGNFRQTLDLSTIAAGVYFLQVEGAHGKHVTRLVVE